MLNQEKTEELEVWRELKNGPRKRGQKRGQAGHSDIRTFYDNQIVGYMSGMSGLTWGETNRGF